MSDVTTLLVHDRLADSDRAALGLLVEYRESFWLRLPASPCFRVLDAASATVDWNPGHRAWGGHVGNACDKAVLLTALHLAGETVISESLGRWWRHLDRSALAAVLRAVAVAAGARAEVAHAGEVTLAQFDAVRSHMVRDK